MASVKSVENKISITKQSFKRHPIPFRYPGGKHYAMGVLRPFFESVVHNEYREPFAGGATVFFNKSKTKVNWLNDADDELINTYKVMKTNSGRQELVSRLSLEIASKERWKEVFNFKPQSNIDIAYKYYYLNRTSFSGKLVSAAWGYRPKRSLPPERWHERIIPCGEKLKTVKLTSGDFEKVIEEPAKESDSQVLMYVDPPYYTPPKKKHYRHGLTEGDHIRLAQALKKTKHKFFLTYDDCPEVRELYSWANVFELNFIYRVSNSQTSNGSRKLGFELVITNYLPEFDN